MALFFNFLDLYATEKSQNWIKLHEKCATYIAQLRSEKKSPIRLLITSQSGHNHLNEQN